MSQQSILRWFNKKKDDKGKVTPVKVEKQQQQQSNENAAKKRKPKDEPNSDDDDDDDFCIILDKAPPTCSPKVTPMKESVATAAPSEVDEELEIVGASHPNALMDFPHSRQDCVRQLMTKEEYCPNCYCYVCDIKASDCQEWAAHCRAKKGDFVWEQMRKAARRERKQATGNQSSSSSPSSGGMDFSDCFSDLFLHYFGSQLQSQQQQQQQQQRRRPNHPTPSPPSRRPPAAAVLEAFPQYDTPDDMDARTSHVFERVPSLMQVATTEREVVQPNALIPNSDPSSVSSLLHRISRKTYPLVSKPPPRARFQTTLHPHQTQSLAFMQQVENALPNNNNNNNTDFGGRSKGGWLASEVGMGKTAIILALVASDNLRCDSSSKPKTTVVLTSASLMGQWEDEVRKHAPNLVVRRFHPTSRSRNPIDLRSNKGTRELVNVDIVISTATFEWPQCVTGTVQFRRVVMDEAHLLSNSTSANIRYANQIRSNLRWCVTATPCTTSLLDLKMQLKFLDISEDGPFGRAFANATNNSNNNNNNLDVFGVMFSKYVTRHEKSQLVNGGGPRGEGATTELIPDKVCKVVSLNMSPQEQRTYQDCTKGLNWTKIRNFEQRGTTSFSLQQSLIHPLSSNKLLLSDSWKDSTKICALYKEIEQLWKQDPNLRAVVFTQYTETHSQVVRALRALFMIPVVYEITGSTSTTDRDFAIRAFQGPKRFPACMVVTLGAGSVGMTLTQASYLYLMEPCLDLASETQAMGRIDRLGQTSKMVMKKFVFSDTIEANLVALHSEIQAGKLSMNKSKVPAAGIKILTRGLTCNNNETTRGRATRSRSGTR